MKGAVSLALVHDLDWGGVTVQWGIEEQCYTYGRFVTKKSYGLKMLSVSCSVRNSSIIGHRVVMRGRATDDKIVLLNRQVQDLNFVRS
jgi:hypothetical protein